MNSRAVLMMLGLLLGVLSFAHAEPKAYDLVKYTGKAAGAKIAFDFADGYSEASEVRITDAASGKTMKFRMDYSDAAAMSFIPEKAGGSSAIKSVSLKLNPDDRAPAKVAGTCVASGKTVSFTLARSKK
jgi:hypothetical protein